MGAEGRKRSDQQRWYQKLESGWQSPLWSTGTFDFTQPRISASYQILPLSKEFRYACYQQIPPFPAQSSLDRGQKCAAYRPSAIYGSSPLDSCWKGAGIFAPNHQNNLLVNGLPSVETVDSANWAHLGGVFTDRVQPFREKVEGESILNYFTQLLACSKCLLQKFMVCYGCGSCFSYM